jgi:uncharacterized protein (TIGR03083 family)
MNHDEFIDHLAVGLGADDVVAALAEAVAVAPPGDLRQRVFADVGKRPRPQVAPVPAPELYALRVAAMADLLDELAGAEWSMPTAPYAWSVLELLGHLTVIEEYTARQFGLTDQLPLPAGASSTVDHLGMGIETIAEVAAAGATMAVQRWRAAATRVVDHVSSAAFEPAAPVPLHAWAFDATTALVARAFEIWTHADDIRRATDRSLDVPTPCELRTMSSASVAALPILLAITNGPAFQPVRVVLTGPGGGTFDLDHATRSDPDGRHLLVVNVVDYCRLAARRIDAAQLAHHRQGDPDFIDAVLQAAHAIAV